MLRLAENKPRNKPKYDYYNFLQNELKCVFV